jgi:D-alanine transaminase
VITVPDNRWERVDIKSVGLLPNALAKQKAKEAGAREAWFVDPEGYVREGASTTAWIVSREGDLVTRPNGPDILPGVTRMTASEVARRAGLKVVERKFTVAEALPRPSRPPCRRSAMSLTATSTGGCSPGSFCRA